MVLGVNEPILGSGCHLIDVIGYVYLFDVNYLFHCHINIISNFKNWK